MKIDDRILGYQQSYELTDSDLLKISGGTGAKITWGFEMTQKATGSWPGVVDFETDQVWD